MTHHPKLSAANLRLLLACALRLARQQRIYLWWHEEGWELL